MASNVRQSVFGDEHPLVPATYFAGTILLSAFVMQPVYLAISLVGSVCCAVLCMGPREALRQLRWQLVVALLVCAGNVLVGHVGDTLLLALGPLEVRLEPLAYGLCMGAMLVCMVEWFSCAGCCLGVDKVLGLGGGLLPTVSTMVSMAMGLVPQLLRRSRQVTATLDACTAAGRSDVPRWNSLRRAARTSNLLMSWSLENSLVRANSMRARGWESGARRTAYRLTTFATRDALLELAIVLLALASAILGGRALADWHFYPTMPQLTWWWGYLPFACYALLPVALHAWERLRWSRWERMS